MSLIHLCGAALNQTPLDWDGNLARIVKAIDAARDTGVSILCLPELCISGYGCEDAFQSPGVQRIAWDVLMELEPRSRGLAVAVGLPIRHESAVYDAAAFLVDGALAGIVCKQHLASDGIHYEPRWFRAWPANRQAELRVSGRDIPIGDLRFDCSGVRIGFEICEDAWVADRPGAALAARGIDVILNPSASHFAFGKDEIRRRFVLEGARSCSAAYVYSNLLGNESGRAVYDGGVFIAMPSGMVAMGRRFGFDEVCLTSALIDLDALRLAQGRSVHSLVSPPSDGRVAVSFSIPSMPVPTPMSVGKHRDAWESGPYVKEEEFARAVALGLFDYGRKSRSRGFVVSASGGADSSAVACLIALAYRFAHQDLALDDMVDRLGIERSEMICTTIDSVVRAMLTCVYQSTANSGSVTRSAAKGLAAALGAEFHEFDVEPLVRGYSEMVANALGRKLTWADDDIALQNIQARARAPGVWMLANVRGALLVSTSNRSEAAVGYATMDGDTSGGIAPIAGIDKAYLRRWLVWLEHVGPEAVGPMPSLAAVNRQSPTAELRPGSAGQTDEADLMPYEILDRIERLAIRDKQLPLAAWRHLAADFPQHDPRQLAFWTKRFFVLWSRNQWKRERYAPCFHLDDENLDPKTWCRFPILSGGFSRELAELSAVVDPA
jgi:NAD+ synthase (glutamine-hydrolysing)